MIAESTESRTRVRVWDLPVRLIHWLVVVLIAVSYVTAKTGHMDYHRYSGYALSGLVAFRLYWGWFGSSTARFAQFVRGPRAVFDYLRGSWPKAVGHNPIGALSVIVLLALMVAQIVLGLFSVDVDGIESGPLSNHVSFDAGRVAAHWHHEVFDAMLWFIALHVLAIAYYLVVKKENLLGAMFTGVREYAVPVMPMRRAHWFAFVVGVLLAAGVVWLIV